ncbi:MAG: hypothetical protein WCO09_01395 [bacterium]
MDDITQQQNNTHLLFDGENIVSSPDIQPVFTFLVEIEREIESILGFNNKLDSLRENYLEMISFVEHLSEKLIKNNIDFKYDTKEPIEKIAERFNFHLPLRSQAIVLFVSLEVLFNLYTAYNNETSDQDKLRELTMNTDKAKKFLNEFVLNDNNPYYKNNKTRLAKIDSNELKDLRNSLTHFFSLGHSGLCLAPSIMDKESRKVENILKQNKKGNVVFISETDLFNLVKEANTMMLKKWSEDFINNSEEFKRKMRFVIDLVKKEGAVIVLNKVINI